MNFLKKYDPKGNYIRKFLPELKNFPSKYIHEPWTAPMKIQNQAKCVLGVDYPVRIIDEMGIHKKFEEAQKLIRIQRKVQNPNNEEVLLNLRKSKNEISGSRMENINLDQLNPKWLSQNSVPAFDIGIESVMNKITLFEEVDRPVKGKFRGTIEPSCALTPSISITTPQRVITKPKMVIEDVIFRREVPLDIHVDQDSLKYDPGAVHYKTADDSGYMLNLKTPHRSHYLSQGNSSFGVQSLTSTQLRNSLFENSEKIHKKDEIKYTDDLKNWKMKYRSNLRNVSGMEKVKMGGFLRFSKTNGSQNPNTGQLKNLKTTEIGVDHAGSHLGSFSKVVRYHSKFSGETFQKMGSRMGVEMGGENEQTKMTFKTGKRGFHQFKEY